jgi:hypothetical protein
MKYREQILNKLEETEEKAKKIDCWRSIVFFIGPMAKTLQYRVNLYKVQLDLAKLGYALEGYKLLPNIEIKEDAEVEVDNKKAPTFAEVEAQNPKKQIDNNIIPQNTKKDSYKKKENKVIHNKFNDGTNNNFANYSEDELEKLLKENQDRKFNPNYKI